MEKIVFALKFNTHLFQSKTLVILKLREIIVQTGMIVVLVDANCFQLYVTPLL